jgi:hypothetical protein
MTPGKISLRERLLKGGKSVPVPSLKLTTIDRMFEKA